ncbi:hypothetical protein [Paenibacillus sp. FSL P4-0081]|uniref:hypothetical protein n=1 Tax=Paenibacillus sp. FSL P4-0081 TaxID=1536769 RepID=UPI0018CDA7A0|nr:hypothetical protein [Paenibacillus sp. FSL P4-0081]
MPDKECPPLTRVVPREFKPLVPSDNTLGMGGFFAVSPAERREAWDGSSGAARSRIFQQFRDPKRGLGFADSAGPAKLGRVPANLANQRRVWLFSPSGPQRSIAGSWTLLFRQG